MSQSLAESSPWETWSWCKYDLGFENKAGAHSQLFLCSQRPGRYILKATTEANSRYISEHANDMGIWAQSCSGLLETEQPASKSLLPEGWGSWDIHPLGSRRHYLRTAQRAATTWHLWRAPRSTRESTQEENHRYLNKRPLVHTKWKVPRGNGQSTSRTCGNELRKKRISWMLIICSSAFLGFLRFEGS